MKFHIFCILIHVTIELIAEAVGALEGGGGQYKLLI